VKVTPGGALSEVRDATTQQVVHKPAGGATVDAPLAGNIYKINVSQGQQIVAGDVVMILEAMKMETEVRASAAGVVAEIFVKEGDAVQVGTPLLSLS
jgi:oxaloacetate decarboxylase alpha subunit